MLARRTIVNKEYAKKLKEKLQASQADEPPKSEDSFQYVTEGDKQVSFETEHVTSEFPSSTIGYEIIENYKTHFVLVGPVGGVKTEDVGENVDIGGKKKKKKKRVSVLRLL